MKLPKSGRMSVNLTVEEARMIQAIKSENSRRGGFLRIFPSIESWKLYSGFLGAFLIIINVLSA